MVALIRRGAVLATCVAAVVLAYRGAGAARTAGEGTPCANAATSTAPYVRQSDDPRTEELFVAPDDEIRCRLRRALVTLDDLPDGWSRTRSGPYNIASGSLGVACDTRWPAPQAGVSDWFAGPSAGGIRAVGQAVYAYDHVAARGLLGALKQSCESRAASTAERTMLTPIDIPEFGDESVAFPGPSSRVDVAWLYIRRGDVMTILLVSTEGDLSDALTQIAAKADAKLAKLGPLPTASSTPRNDATAAGP